ncbi:MAG: PAS domain S-box protein [Candidatus Hydrogenedentes bacterium]|nr:PAS domain S-box protein [Candidatus Hydrogenedentota bacterium]
MKRTQERILWYLMPILIGLGGVLFANEFDSVITRFAVVLVSVSVPLFASGNMLARRDDAGTGKFVLLAGVLMLMIGAAASVAQLPGTMGQEIFSQRIVGVSRWLGSFSLVLGLFVVLLSVFRTGAAAAELGERFRHLADLMSEGFILSSPDGTIVLVNQQFLDMLDLSEDQVVGENATELVSRMNVNTIQPHLDMRAKGLASEYENAWHVRGEERQFWVHGAPIFDRYGRHAGTLATFRDITERNRMAKRLERYAKGLQELVEEKTQKLMRSEQQFRDLLLFMNEGFITVDSSYQIQFANNRICELLRISPQTIRGCEVFDFVDPPGRMKLMELLKAGGAGDALEGPNEFSFVCIDGTLVTAVVAVAPVQGDSQTGARYSLVITDVTELKRMQRQLEMRASELEAANEELRAYGRAKDSFLSNVSHELKTPLSTISGYIEMLDSGGLGRIDVPQGSALKVMSRNAKRLVGLINEMLEFSRMEIRGIQITQRLFNTDNLVRESIASIQPQALAKDLSIGIFVHENAPPVWADRDKISQVLAILLSNAVKFSHEGGMLQVQVVERAHGTLAISVGDTGIGIAPAYHARIFDKFFQVDSSLTRRYEGTGIGLSIAKSIVEAHHGTLELASELGKGSTFTIVLPGALFDSNVPPRLRKGLERLRVLVVADNRTFRGVLEEVLAQCGCAVEQANNGYECLRLAEETRPDLILFNEILSNVAGVPMIANLRQNPETVDIPVLILSGEDPSKLEEVCNTASGVYFLEKPFNARGLIGEIRAICLGEPVPCEHDAAEPAHYAFRVLVVDADADLLEWIEFALRHKHMTCWNASSAAHALELAQRHHPDAILLDGDAPPPLLRNNLDVLRESIVTEDIPIFVMGGGTPAVVPTKGRAVVIKKPFSVEDLVRHMQAALEARTVLV